MHAVHLETCISLHRALQTGSAVVAPQVSVVDGVDHSNTVVNH